MTDLPGSFRSFLESEPPPSEGDMARRLFKDLSHWDSREEGNLLQDAVELIKQGGGGLQTAANVLSRLEVALGFRKPTLGLYDNALHFIGGAQKYGCTLAQALQDEFDITLIANSEITTEQLGSWYGLDLSRCRIKVIGMPYFERSEEERGVFDAGLVDLKGDNPFHAISMESGLYDVFVNNCMLEMIYPLASVSEMVVHFPEREISRFFQVGRYTHIIHNSLYTAEWIRKRWQIDPHVHVYPPVDMTAPLQDCLARKQDIILSVARFEPGGNKQQREMIRAYLQLRRLYPHETSGWRLILAGGSTEVNPYLERLQNWLTDAAVPEIELRVNLGLEELRELYGKARIFWHFSGLGQRDPARIEHFGMTTVEAMQNACVPVVFRGGGQTEIVEDGISGTLFDTTRELLDHTRGLMKDPPKAEELAKSAHARGQTFTREVFTEKIRGHFLGILREYSFEEITGD